MSSLRPHCILLALVALLATFANTLSIYERPGGSFSYANSLQARDGPFDPPLPACISPCGPGCVGPYANLEPPSLLKKRDFDLVSAGPEWQSLNPQYLVERNLYPVTAGNVDKWIANKVTDKNKGTVQLIFPDADGKWPSWLECVMALTRLTGDYSSTTVQKTFDGSKYELGTVGLTGCSVLTVVSRRGVFMGHFFESLAFSRPTQKQLEAEGQDPATYPKLNFVGEVTNLIDQSKGTTAGVGPSLDVSLFNQDGDNTKAYIMTPRAWNGQAGSPQYTNKINSIISQVQGLLPSIGDIPIYDYVRLNMEDPAEEAELYTNARGAAFFQYDPSNRGKQAWRLFYERGLANGDAEDSW